MRKLSHAPALANPFAEEVAEKKQTLEQITNELADAISYRASFGRDYGIVLVPEVFHSPDTLLFAAHRLSGSDRVRARDERPHRRAQRAARQGHQPRPRAPSVYRLPAGLTLPVPSQIRSKLSPQSQALFDFLPKQIREELMLDRDPHGNVQVSKIETEKLLIHLVTQARARSAIFFSCFRSHRSFAMYVAPALVASPI